MSVFNPPAAAPPLIHPQRPLWLVITLACLASFMVIVDGSIVNVALPAMQRDLQLSPMAQQWVVDAYLLTFGGCMLLAARAGDLYGRRPVLQAGLALFTLASLAGGLAASGPWLLAARAAQGLGASVLASSSMALVMAATHHDKAARARALSLWAALNSAGFAFGVVIGGVLTDGPGWRWVMFVNVPLGLALMAGVAASLLAPPRRVKRPPLDIPGALTATLGCGALIYGITQSMSQGWGSAAAAGALAASVMLMGFFFVIESRSPHPLVRLSIFHLPNLRAGNLLMLCLGATLTASIYLISTVLQQVAGYSAQDTGLAMLPMGLVLAAARLVFSRTLAQGGGRLLPFWGALLAAGGLAWLGGLPLQADYVTHVLGPTLMAGFGLGMVILSATHAVTGGVPVQDAGMASGIANTARQLGGALGVAVLTTLAHAVGQGREVQHLAAPAALLRGYHAAFFAAAVICVLCGLISLALRRPAP